MKRLIALLFGLCSCSTHYPKWSNATEAQRQRGQFEFDDAYRKTSEYQAGIQQSAETVDRLKEQLRRNLQ